jgi:hypothetical protein
MSKYNRHQSVVSRQADASADENNWMNKLYKSLEKAAVQPKSVDQSLFHQINSIMNTKAKYPSVAAAVDDMKERSGLTAYLDKINKLSQESIEKTKIASDQNKAIDKKVDLTPIVIQKFPSIKNTIENYIKDTKGNLPVPSIVEKIKSIHRSDVSDAKDWDDDNLIRFISNRNLRAKKDNPSYFEVNNNLGTRDIMSDSEIDPSNTDAFHGLNPVKF